jgi:hypothetical protein
MLALTDVQNVKRVYRGAITQAMVVGIPDRIYDVDGIAQFDRLSQSRVD